MAIAFFVCAWSSSGRTVFLELKTDENVLRMGTDKKEEKYSWQKGETRVESTRRMVKQLY